MTFFEQLFEKLGETFFWNFEQLVERTKHQHISLDLGQKNYPDISLKKNAVTWILARVFEYLPSFFSQILDLIYWTVPIFILMWRDTEHQQFKAGFRGTIFRLRLDGLTEKGLCVAWTIFENKLNSFRKIMPPKIWSSNN